jgi:hypothetical protein
MAKNDYIPWSPAEERNLLRWLSQHQHLSWEEIAEEYFRQYGIPRTVNSLLGKLGQLERGVVRQRPVSARAPAFPRGTARQSRHQRQRNIDGFPTSPPTFISRDPDPSVRRLLQQLRQLQVSCDPMLSEDASHFSRLAGSITPGMQSLIVNVLGKSKANILFRIRQGFTSASKTATTSPSVILGSHQSHNREKEVQGITRRWCSYI